MRKGFMDAVISAVFRNYANFKGRMSRSEYWCFVFVVFLLSCFLFCFGAIGVPWYYSHVYFYRLLPLIGLVLFIPVVAATVRRLHDIGKSGWHFFVVFIPLIGVLILLYWLIKDSQQCANKLGSQQTPQVVPQTNPQPHSRTVSQVNSQQASQPMSQVNLQLDNPNEVKRKQVQYERKQPPRVRKIK